MTDNNPMTDRPRRRCVATNRAGTRCKLAPIPGGTVCVLHGGRAPQTRAAAERALLYGRDLAIDQLISTLEARPPCPACGRSDADRDPVVIRAAQIVLDRTGHHPTLDVRTVSGGLPDYFAWIPPHRLAQMEAWMREADAAMRRGAPQPMVALPPADVLDGDVLDADADAPVGAAPTGNGPTGEPNDP
jgi:hypothetical protein